jgi:hypothetical protein
MHTPLQKHNATTRTNNEHTIDNPCEQHAKNKGATRSSVAQTYKNENSSRDKTIRFQKTTLCGKDATSWRSNHCTAQISLVGKCLNQGCDRAPWSRKATTCDPKPFILGEGGESRKGLRISYAPYSGAPSIEQRSIASLGTCISRLKCKKKAWVSLKAPGGPPLIR